MNKCEELKIEHAWRGSDPLVIGFSTQDTQVCVNCGLKRSKHRTIREWYSYSDERPDEEIVVMRPV